ncbi:MAG: hypothetical protein RL516_1681 [Bacteroidota bacterium]|jgi:type I restriction enzyme S subunit
MKWETVSLGSIIDLSKGKKHDFNPKGNNRYLTIEDLHNPDNSAFTNENGTLVMESDLIIAWDGANAGKVGVGYNGVIGSTLARMRIKVMNFDSRFLFWFLVSKNELIKSQRTGATIPHVNGAALKEIQIPLPPLPIQKRIADILDAADALRKKDEALLKKYDELAQAIFIDMFGDPVKNEKGWEVKNGSTLLKIIGGAAFKSQDYCEEGIPLIRIGTINKGYFDKNQMAFMPLKFKDEYQRFIVKPGDLLMTLTGTVGKEDYGNVLMLDNSYNKYFLNQRVAKIETTHNNLTLLYLFWYFKQKSIRSELTDVSRGVRQANISNQDIYSLKIPIPPLSLQLNFANAISILQLSDKFCDINKSKSLFLTLINKAFSGELVS